MILARNFLSFHSIFRLFQKAHHSLQGSLPASEVLLPEPGTDMGKGSVQAEVPKGRALPPQLPAQSLFGTRLVLPALMLVLSESRAGMRRALPWPSGRARRGGSRSAPGWESPCGHAVEDPGQVLLADLGLQMLHLPRVGQDEEGGP